MPSIAAMKSRLLSFLLVGLALLGLASCSSTSEIIAAGLRVEVAEDGAAAVEMARTRTYDLVLMDVQMPVMDGFAATGAIRQELKLDLPILAMTAGVMQSEQERCIAAGMNDFIAKPIDVEQMLDIVLRHIPAGRRP